jgi:hypothetical protein
MHGEAHPLRAISSPMHRAVKQLSPLTTVALSRRCRPPAPRGWWSLTRSSPISRVQCRSRRHRLFGSDAVRQLPAPYVRLASKALFESHLAAVVAELASQTCENQAPTRECGLDINEHERDAFCRVVRGSLARSPESHRSGFDPTALRLAHPFAAAPLRLHALLSKSLQTIRPVFGRVP